mgnify:CR=1 FL=1
MVIKLRIKDILKEKGISSKELAESLGKAPQYVSNIINGGKGASLSTLSEIANILNVNMGDLFAPTKEEHTKSDFFAFFKQGDKYHHASSIIEAEEIIRKIKDGEI